MACYSYEKTKVGHTEKAFLGCEFLNLVNMYCKTWLSDRLSQRSGSYSRNVGKKSQVASLRDQWQSSIDTGLLLDTIV